MKYGPCSYYTLGWSGPRDSLREPFPRRRHRAFGQIWLIPVPVPVIVKMAIAGEGTLLISGVGGEELLMPLGASPALSYSSADNEGVSG